MIRTFRLPNEPGGLGLHARRPGARRRSAAAQDRPGFAPRPPNEIDALIGADRPDVEYPRRLRASLGAIAQALNRGDHAYAGIAAVLTATPERDAESAARLVELNRQLAKYSEDQPPDWHGRWTDEEAGGRRPFGKSYIYSGTINLFRLNRFQVTHWFGRKRAVPLRF